MDSRNRRDGAAIEELGWYDPIIADKEKNYSLNEERIMYWLGEGAQLTDAAKKLLRRAGLSHRWHLMQQGLEESELDKEMKKWELNREDVLKVRAERDVEKAKEKAKKVKEAASSEEGTSDDAPKEELTDEEGGQTDDSSLEDATMEEE